MAVQSLKPKEFLSYSSLSPILDVRSPGEYRHAHIPGAISLPLFNDKERAIVGTAYKQESREAAIKLGLDYFGSKMRNMVEEAENFIKAGPNPSEKTILIHCWRGGMRSGAVAWLLDLYGFKVYTLEGGYKAYRNWVLAQFEKSYSFNILGGNTGSGKTYILLNMRKKGHHIIDLEGLANHKGSAFGNIGMPEQPGPEMFENMLAKELFYQSDGGNTIWLEDESQRIGNVHIPVALWQTMRTSPVYFLKIPFDERLKFLIKEYGILEKERLVNAIIRIRKRLGGLETKNAISFLIEDNVEEAFRILLHYYDKFYNRSLQNRSDWEKLVHYIPCIDVDENKNYHLIIDKAGFVTSG